MAASTASTTALLVPAGGTNTTDTSAPVLSMASWTEPNTGTEVPSKSTLWPAFLGFTPPTMLVPEAIIRRVCFWPSEPVMPCTTTLELSFRKMDMLRPSLVRQLGGAVRRAVHGVHQRDQRVVRVVQDPPALLDVVAVEAYDERLVGLVAEDLQRRDDPVGDRVARGDAAEDVHEDALHLLVVEDHVEPGRHHLRGGAAADVEEVRGLHPVVLLTGVRDDVEGRHHQAGAVADDAHRPVELDVVEALLLRLRLQGVGRGLVLERRVVLVTEARVLVQRHLAVEGLQVAVAEQGQRVDLDQGGVLLDEDVPQLLDDLAGLVGHLGREARGGHDLGGLRVVDAGLGVDRDLRERLGVVVGDDLDLDTALHAGDAEVAAVGPVDEEGEVVLVLDVRGGRDEHPVDGQALDVHAEDVAGARHGLLRGLGELDAAGLASAAGLDLGLDDHPSALALGGCGGVLRLLDDGADSDRHAVLGEELLRLVLHQVHGSDRPLRVDRSSPGHVRPVPGGITADLSPVRPAASREGFRTLPHMPPAPVASRVRSGDLALAVREHSPAGPGRPTVVLVHGYPDRQATWATLLQHLPLDGWHVVTYDVRGAGESDVPVRRAGYRTERLVGDPVAGLGAVLPAGGRAHPVRPDWGGLQLWGAGAAGSNDSTE